MSYSRSIVFLFFVSLLVPSMSFAEENPQGAFNSGDLRGSDGSYLGQVPPGNNAAGYEIITHQFQDHSN